MFTQAILQLKERKSALISNRPEADINYKVGKSYTSPFNNELEPVQRVWENQKLRKSVIELIRGFEFDKNFDRTQAAS